MNVYSSDGHRDVEAKSMREAAEVFALRKARKRFGKSARVAALRMDGRREDGLAEEFEAFIGRPAPGERYATDGVDVRFVVWLYREGGAQ